MSDPPLRLPKAPSALSPDVILAAPLSIARTTVTGAHAVMSKSMIIAAAAAVFDRCAKSATRGGVAAPPASSSPAPRGMDSTAGAMLVILRTHSIKVLSWAKERCFSAMKSKRASLHVMNNRAVDEAEERSQ
jgi:hypothetical protein